MKRFRLLALAAMIPMLVLTSCGREDLEGNQYGIFKVSNDTTVVVNGVIDSQTGLDWNDLVRDYPNIRLVILEDCPGSEDDDANLKMALDIHRQGMNMHLRSNSIIESGAVDLYLAGHRRTRDRGAKVGVHSWSDGSGLEGGQLPKDDPQHQTYINYFKNVGMPAQMASDFYFFTLEAASANNIHYMTEAELAQYDFFTNE